MSKLQDAVIDATEQGFTVMFSFDRPLGDIRTAVTNANQNAIASSRVSRKYAQEAEFDVLADTVTDCVQSLIQAENLVSPTGEAILPESKSLTPRGDK